MPTIHHWSDWQQGLREMRRVARRQVVVTFDVGVSAMWLVRDYLPEVADLDRGRTPTPDEIAGMLRGAQVEPLLVPADMQDAVLAAHWARPEAYLDPAVQAAASGIGQQPAKVVQRAVDALRRNLDDGARDERYGHLRSESFLDAGYRIITSQPQIFGACGRARARRVSPRPVGTGLRTRSPAVRDSVGGSARGVDSYLEEADDEATGRQPMPIRGTGDAMPRYMIRASYTLEGLQGLLKEGGTGRKKAIETLASSLGGHLVSLDYAFGSDDVYGICELPDDETAAAISMRISASGSANVDTIKLLTPEQIDVAIDREMEYRKPGA